MVMSAALTAFLSTPQGQINLSCQINMASNGPDWCSLCLTLRGMTSEAHRNIAKLEASAKQSSWQPLFLIASPQKATSLSFP